VGYFALRDDWWGAKFVHEIHLNGLMETERCLMKPNQIAYVVLGLAVVVFLYELHAIHGQKAEAQILLAQIKHNQTPEAGSLFRAFFDGLTLGSFAKDGIFTEADKSENEYKQLSAQWVNLVNRNEESVQIRNWSIGIGCLTIILMPISSKKKSG